jgi:hypothetical protein
MAIIPFETKDLTEEARSRYTQQFEYSSHPVFDNYITIVMDELQELQNLFKDLTQLRDLDNAVGAQLDLIGAIVGQPRLLVDFTLSPFFGFDGATNAQTFGTLSSGSIGGVWKSVSDKEGEDTLLGDDDYRFIIRARIAANISNTSPQGVLDAVNYILQRTDTEIEEVQPASVIIKHFAVLTPIQEYFLRGLSSVGSIIPLPICVSYTLVRGNTNLIITEDGDTMIEEDGSSIVGE